MENTIKNDEIKINKYHNGKVYKIVNDIDDKVYIGSTCQPLYKRLYEHKRDAKINKNKERLVYKHYNEIGINNMQIILVEEYKCENKMELEKKEREYIEQYKGVNILNKKIPTRNIKEWYNDNEEKIKKIQSNYYNENKDKIKKKYNDNKDIIAEGGKLKYTCDCGSELRKSDKSRHLKTNKHINYINNLNKK